MDQENKKDKKKCCSREIVLNCSGKIRLSMQIALATWALLHTSMISYFTFIVFPSLPFHAIVMRLSSSIFLINSLLVLEGFVFKVVSRIDHISWKIGKELFNCTFSIAMGSSMVFFQFVASIDARGIPDYIWGPKLQGVFGFARSMGYFNGLCNVAFGVLCLFSFKHYKFVLEQLKDDPEIYRKHLEDLERIEDYRRGKRLDRTRRKALTVGFVMVKPGTRERYLKHHARTTERQTITSKYSYRKTATDNLSPLKKVKSGNFMRKKIKKDEQEERRSRHSRPRSRPHVAEVAISETDVDEDHEDFEVIKGRRSTYGILVKDQLPPMSELPPAIVYRDEDLERQTLRQTLLKSETAQDSEPRSSHLSRLRALDETRATNASVKFGQSSEENNSKKREGPPRRRNTGVPQEFRREEVRSSQDSRTSDPRSVEGGPRRQDPRPGADSRTRQDYPRRRNTGRPEDVRGNRSPQGQPSTSRRADPQSSRRPQGRR